MLNLCREFQELLHRACKKSQGELILLSGGLDSSILLYYLQSREAVTISMNPYSSDYLYSTIIAKRYSINHHIVMPSMEVIIENLEELVRDFKTFDPIFLKNSVVQLLGFKEAKRLKVNEIALGDGADELFGGYNFLSKYLNSPEILQSKLNEISQNMEFVSFKISKKYNIRIRTPFLDDAIMKFSQSLAVKDKIAIHKGIIYGKFFLRCCFREILGDEIAWRRKEALESGSGINKILPYLENWITGKNFLEGSRKAKNEGVLIRTKEHMFYYQLYRKFFDPPIHQIGDHPEKSRRCPSCNTIFIWNGSFCKTCGAYPV
ncbi:MAG: asparagine synthase C-terminal domain-containing protein [Candidatus Nitrosocosmicus sp.]|nr:asparagine synthase C-terminal domain-containing protein [Candidatus Nitrosocosmicus sp.]MDN5866072.1 asparagine synthase C-terminal domain-containing protein [Candidatus Nitrosocosmicus sp.]